MFRMADPDGGVLPTIGFLVRGVSGGTAPCYASGARRTIAAAAR